jgi:hypothetical protein
LFVEEFRFLPDLSDESPIGLVYADFKFRNRSGAAALVEQGERGPFGLAGVLAVALDKKTRRDVRRKNKQAAKVFLANPVPVKRKVPINIPAANPVANPMVKPAILPNGTPPKGTLCCSKYCSAAGCTWGAKCKYAHEIPAAGAWHEMRKYFDDRKIEASTEFAAGEP